MWSVGTMGRGAYVTEVIGRGSETGGGLGFWVGACCTRWGAGVDGRDNVGALGLGVDPAGAARDAVRMVLELPAPPARAASGTRDRGARCDMGPEEFRAAGHELIDWIADYRTRIPQLPVQAQVKPGEVAAKPARRRPPQAGAVRAVLADLERVVVPGLTLGPASRGSSATSPPTRSLGRVLGDSAAGLGVLGLSWQSAPALTELEEVVHDWLRRWSGSPTLERRHPGHRLDQHAGRPALRRANARPTTGRRAAACRRSPRRWSSTPRRTPQLGRQGGAPGRLRPRQPSPGRDRRPTTPCAPTRWRRADRAATRRAARALRRRRDRRHDATDRHRPDRRDRRGRRAPRAVAARRRGDGRLGDDPAGVPLDVATASRAPTRWCSTRTMAGRRARLLALLRRATREHLVRVMSTNPSYLQSAADGG